MHVCVCVCVCVFVLKKCRKRVRASTVLLIVIGTKLDTHVNDSKQCDHRVVCSFEHRRSEFLNNTQSEEKRTTVPICYTIILIDIP